jgi:hypothetical protein
MIINADYWHYGGVSYLFMTVCGYEPSYRKNIPERRME